MTKNIEIKVEYCEKCPFCKWRTEQMGNTGWICGHPASGERLILVKSDYDADHSKHVWIPAWCPLRFTVFIVRAK